MVYAKRTDKMYYAWCMLHGIHGDQNVHWTVNSVKGWIHGLLRISSQEDSKPHRQTAINRICFTSKYTGFERIKRGNNDKIMHNRKVVKILMRNVTP